MIPIIKPKTKQEIKSQLTKMYQLRKELRQNIENSKLALKDVDNIINTLTSQLENMEKEIKNGTL